VSEQKFCLHLLHGLPDKGRWIQFKGHFQYRVQLFEAEVMAAFHIEQRNQLFLSPLKGGPTGKDKDAEKAKDKKDDNRGTPHIPAQVCWFCKKAGHTSKQCWHKPQGWV
jgi:hypothetical protein